MACCNNKINAGEEGLIRNRKLANAFGKDAKEDMRIYSNSIGKVKFYGFEPANTRKPQGQTVEIIQFQQPAGDNVLQNVEETGLALADTGQGQEKAIHPKRHRKDVKSVAKDSGAVLPDDGQSRV